MSGRYGCTMCGGTGKLTGVVGTGYGATCPCVGKKPPTEKHVLVMSVYKTGRNHGDDTHTLNLHSINAELLMLNVPKEEFERCTAERAYYRVTVEAITPEEASEG